MMIAPLADIPRDLGRNDVGFLFCVSDYAHVLRWTGLNWEWGPGEEGSGYIRAFLVDPDSNGWKLCDGSTVNYLKSDGTLGSIALPDLVAAPGDAAYLKMGGAVSGPNAASAGTLTMNSYTPGGSNSSPAFTGTPATPTGTVSAVPANSDTITFLQGAGAEITVATDIHAHTAPTFTGNSAAPAGSVAAPVFSGTPATLTGTVASTGQPRNLVLRPFFRK